MIIAFIAVIFLSLATYVVPVILARQRVWRDADDYHTASRSTTGSIFQNSSVAYALQMATFGPFFIWGATGDYAPAIVNSVLLAFGLGVIFLFRAQIVDYLRHSLRKNDSITIHEFISEAHGRSRAVRFSASLLTIFALSGIIMSEMYVSAQFLRPLLGNNLNITYVIFIVMFLFMLIYTLVGGNAGVMRADQLQLGVAYVAMFAALSGMLIFTSALGTSVAATHLPSLMMILVILAVLFGLKHVRFIDYSVNAVADTELGKRRLIKWAASAYGIMERCLNVIIVSAALVCLGTVIYLIFRFGPSQIGHAISSVTHPKTNTSVIALIALALLPLVYQICDITNWQRLAAFRPDHDPREVGVKFDDPARERRGVNDAAIKKGLLGYAIEAPAVWVLMLLFGAAALLYPGGLKSSDPIGSFVTGLAGGGVGGQFILGTLLVGVFAIALSTMDAVLSASLLAFRYDILPFLERKRSADSHSHAESGARRRTAYFGVALYVCIIGLFYLSERFLKLDVNNYLAILLAFYSAQIAFFPLIIGGLLKSGGRFQFLDAGPHGALWTLAAGFVVAIGMTVWGLCFNGGDLFSWGAIPGAFIAGMVTYAGACTWHYFSGKKGGEQDPTVAVA